MQIEIVLVEDEGWSRLRPLTWLRPAADLFVGARTNAERWKAATKTDPMVVCRHAVAALDPARRTAVPPVGRSLRLWVRDRWVPDSGWASGAIGRGRAHFVHDGTVVAVLTEAEPPSGPTPGSDPFWQGLAQSVAGGEEVRAEGSFLNEVSDLIPLSASWLVRDLEDQIVKLPPAASFGDGFAYAPDRIRVGTGCRIDRGAVLDAREGVIVLGAGTVVFPHTWIRGPFGCRENCLLLGGRIGGGSYLGPDCRVRGEVEASTLHGFVNKAHDGFVGHSYVAEWVNLGALTTTSDLKNNYGTVHLEAYGRRVETGQQKIGSVIGDHAKTRIGAMLNSGSVIGLAANLFGDAGIFPRWVPDFSWGVGSDASEYDLERCLTTVDTVMGRRGLVCPPVLREAIGQAFRQSQADRDRFLGRQR